jgi:hypothetical protein
MARDQGKLFMLDGVLMPHASCTDKYGKQFLLKNERKYYHIEDEMCELRDTTFPLGMHLILLLLLLLLLLLF